jgi:hypothetical protein
MRFSSWGCLAGVLFASTALAQPPLPAAGDGLQGPDQAATLAPLLAERIHMRLDYAGAAGCAEPELFRDAARLHVFLWDPFAPVSPWPLTVRVTRNGGGYAGRGSLVTPDGEVFWSAAAPGPMRCVDVLIKLASSLAAAVLPLPTPPKPAPPPEQKTCPECPPAPPAPECTPEPLPPPLEVPGPTKPPPEKPPFAFRVGAAAGADFFATDGGALGLSADFGVRYREFSAAIDAHGDPPLGSHLVTNVGSVSEARVMGALLLCGHYGHFIGCGQAAGGAVLFPGHVPLLPASTRYGAAGIRLGLEFELAPRFFLRVGLDVLLPFWRTNFPGLQPGGSVFEIISPNIGLGLGGLWELGKL